MGDCGGGPVDIWFGVLAKVGCSLEGAHPGAYLQVYG